jgi:hypothetical protein
MVGGVTVKLVALKQEAGHLDTHFLGVTLPTLLVHAFRYMYLHPPRYTL